MVLASEYCCFRKWGEVVPLGTGAGRNADVSIVLDRMPGVKGSVPSLEPATKSRDGQYRLVDAPASSLWTHTLPLQLAEV